MRDGQGRGGARRYRSKDKPSVAVGTVWVARQPGLMSCYIIQNCVRIAHQ